MLTIDPAARPADAAPVEFSATGMPIWFDVLGANDAEPEYTAASGCPTDPDTCAADKFTLAAAPFAGNVTVPKTALLTVSTNCTVPSAAGATVAVRVEFVRPATAVKAVVVPAHPVDEFHHVGIAPHPGREALKRRLGRGSRRAMAHISVHRRRIGPVRFHRDNGESVFLDQVAGDRCSSAVEFRGSMAGLAQQHHTAIGIAVEQPAESRIVKIRQRLPGGGNHVGQTLSA